MRLLKALVFNPVFVAVKLWQYNVIVVQTDFVHTLNLILHCEQNSCKSVDNSVERHNLCQMTHLTVII